VTRQFLAAVLSLTFAACSPKPPASEASSVPWFRDVADEAGIRFTHVTGATGQFFMPEIMGSGCALLDYDADGDLDVFLLQGAPLDRQERGSGSRLYRNEVIPSGKLQFTDVSGKTGLDFAGYGMGAATGDIDNDGRIDVIVTGYGGNALFQNQGGGRFKNVTAHSPEIVLSGRWSSGAAFFDFDRDGRQDLAILNYLDYSVGKNKTCHAPSGEVTYCTPKAYPATSAHLFHNEGGRFVDVTKRSGIDRALGRGLGIAAFDANKDGWPDLFVANDAGANHLWINERNGTFRERALEMGVAYGDEGLAKAGMGVAVDDYDNDGDEDLLVLNLMREGATLFENSGNGGFTDVSSKTGIHALTFPYTGFGAGWFDFDGDGRLDVFIANGAVTLREEQRGDPYPFRERNLLIRSAAGKQVFEDVTTRAGKPFDRLEVTRGAAFGDIDNDGDIDILITNNNGPSRVLRNDLPGRNWLIVQIDAAGLGVGARVAVKVEGLPELWRRVHTDGSYLAASDTRVHFGLAGSPRIERITVHWPDGSTSSYTDAKLNSVRHITRPTH
jgi:enediyne biosynthesis protein E4